MKRLALMLMGGLLLIANVALADGYGSPPSDEQIGPASAAALLSPAASTPARVLRGTGTASAACQASGSRDLASCLRHRGRMVALREMVASYFQILSPETICFSLPSLPSS